MLLQVIDLGDSMDFTVLPGSQQDSLTCNMEGVPTDDSNLVIKVGRLPSLTLPSAVPWGATQYLSGVLSPGVHGGYTQVTPLLHAAALENILPVGLLPKNSEACCHSTQQLHCEVMLLPASVRLLPPEARSLPRAPTQVAVLGARDTRTQ